MIKPEQTIVTTEHSHPVTLLTLGTHKPFDQVIADFEKQLGRLDDNLAMSSPHLSDTVKDMEGSSGLMIIHVLEMGRLLPSFISEGRRARQYLIGNPLIASVMAASAPLAALYAPPRVLIYTGEGKTWIAYDQPSTEFGRFGFDDVTQTARDLDQKFELLVQHSLQ